MIQARDIRSKDRIMWAGYRCTVLRSERLPRERYQHKIYMSLDLLVPDKPDRQGVRYEVNEWVEEWDESSERARDTSR